MYMSQGWVVLYYKRFGIETFVYIRLYDATFSGVCNKMFMQVHVRGQCYTIYRILYDRNMSQGQIIS